MNKKKPSAGMVLSRPYKKILSRQPEGGWVAEIREIPGCYASGKSESEAIDALNKHVKELVEVYLRKGQPVPLPTPTEFSGNFALRMPKSMHQKATELASMDGTSLNQFIVAAVSERIGYSIRPVFVPASSINLNFMATIQLGGGPQSTTIWNHVPPIPAGQMSYELNQVNVGKENG